MQLAIFRNVCQPKVDRLLRRGNLHLPALNLDCAAGGGHHAENRPRHIRASCADQPCHAQYFPFT